MRRCWPRCAQGARADDEVGFVREDRRDEFGQVLRVIAVVAVEEDDDVGRLQACVATQGGDAA